MNYIGLNETGQLMKRLLLSAIFILPLFCFSQTLFKGWVMDENQKPVPNASVFLSNTSVGTRANDDGYFQIHVPQGRYDLIVSSVGFETYAGPISSNAAVDTIRITLKIKAPELETVLIEPFEKNGWEKWGKFFTENFIGTMANAADCKILNKEVIRFRHSKKNKELIAIATEPLKIENRALGYTVTLQLESFRYAFNTNYLVYIGYAFFQPMKGNQNKQKKWEKARQDAYYGSLMHFMRSVYRNTIKDEGFEVRRLYKIVNEEKQRVKSIYANAPRTPGGMVSMVRAVPDTMEYYEKILRQKDVFDKIGKDLLPGDSIAYAHDSTTAVLEFADQLLVTYTRSYAPIEFRRLYPQGNTSMTSELTLINEMPVLMEASGNYYNPADLLSKGYWAWSEKIAMMLPFDYKP